MTLLGIYGISVPTTSIAILLLGIAGLSLAMIGPMASGESISSNDVVRTINAFSKMIGLSRPPEKQQLPAPKDKGGKRR